MLLDDNLTADELSEANAAIRANRKRYRVTISDMETGHQVEDWIVLVPDASDFAPDNALAAIAKVNAHAQLFH